LIQSFNDGNKFIDLGSNPEIVLKKAITTKYSDLKRAIKIFL